MSVGVTEGKARVNGTGVCLAVGGMDVCVAANGEGMGVGNTWTEKLHASSNSAPNAGIIIGSNHVRCFIAFSLFVVGISDYKRLPQDFGSLIGTWKDHPTGEPFEGPITLRDYPAPLERLPLR